MQRSAVDETTPLPDGTDSESRLTRRQALGLLGALALPLTAADAADLTVSTPAAPPPMPALPDLPNFHPMMEWLAREHAPKFSFLDERWAASGLESWKQMARAFLQERLSYRPTAVPLQADVLRREERDGYTLEVVDISATPAYHIPARVLIHPGATGNGPPSWRCTVTADVTPGDTKRYFHRRTNRRC